MSSILERSGLGYLFSEVEKKRQALFSSAVPVNQDEQELALALSGATILSQVKNGPTQQVSFSDLRRDLGRPVKELILAVDRLVQLGLLEYGEGDVIRLSELGRQLT